MGDVGALIIVDPAVMDVRDAYAHVWGDFDRSLRLLRSSPAEQARDKVRIERLTKRVNEGTNRVVALARAHLTEVDVAPELPDPAPWWKIWE